MAQQPYLTEEELGFSKDKPAEQKYLSESEMGFKPAASGALRRGIADKAVGFASGAIGATKAIADAAGAGNAVSNALDSATKTVDDYLSPEAKADQQTQQRILEEAKGKGIWEGVKAGARAFAEAPVQTAVQGLGSVVPVLAGSVAGLPGALATGAAIGAGSVKGSIYDDVKKRGMDAGLSEQDAAARADQSQAYTGENADQIALGVGLGMADSATGVSRIAGNMVRGAIRKPVQEVAKDAVEHGIVRRTAMGALGEAPLEAAQGGQEQVAANVAAQRAGYNADTWEGVAGKATLEGLASVGPGGVFGAMEGRGGRNATPAAPEATPPTTPQPGTDGAPPALGYNPLAGTPIVFPDGSVSLNSEQAFEKRYAPQPVKPSEEMGLVPTEAPSLTNAAIVAADSGAHANEVQLAQASEAEQAAYNSVDLDSTDKPVTSGPIAEAAMSEDDKRAVLYSNQPVTDGGQRYEGTQDGDILNGMAAPFTTRLAAQRRAQMEGKDWTVVPVFDGYVARRKDALKETNGTTDAVQPLSGTSLPNGRDNSASSLDDGAINAGRDGRADAGAQTPSNLGQSGEHSSAPIEQALNDQPTGETANEPQADQTQQSQPQEAPSKAATEPVALKRATPEQRKANLAMLKAKMLAGRKQPAATQPIIHTEKDGHPSQSLGEQLSNSEQKDNESAQPTAPEAKAKATERANAAWYVLSDEEKDDAHAILSHKLGQGKPISILSLPVEIQNKLGNSEASSLKEAIALDPQAAVDALAKKQPAQPAANAGEGAGGSQPTQEATPTQGGFDSKAFDKARDDTIKASRAAGNTHLDTVPPYVESMRGKKIYYAHDPKVTGTIRTVDNNGNVHVYWSDEYSAGKESASPVTEGKKSFMGSMLGRSDLKDYVIAKQPEQKAPDSASTPVKKPRGILAKKAEAEKNALSSANQPALDRIANGDAWFGNELKARNWVQKNGLADTHDVRMTKPGRFDVVAKAAPAPANNGPAATNSVADERQTRIASALANGGHVVGDQLRDRSGLRLMQLTPDELASVPADKVRPQKPEIVVDKAEMRPYRKPDGSVGYEAVPIVDAKNEESKYPSQEMINEALRLDVRNPGTMTEAALSAAIDAAKQRQKEEHAKIKAQIEGKPAVSANTIFTEDAAAKARAFLKSKLGTLQSGIDPEMLQAGLTLAGYHIEKGARTFAAYAKAMIDDLGDSVRPYLKSWYMGVKYDPRAAAFEGMDSAADVEAADTLAKQVPNADTPAKDQANEQTNTGSENPQALGDMAPEQDGGTESKRRVGRGRKGRSAGSVSDDSGITEPRVSGTRSGGSGSTSVRAPKPGGTGRGRRTGAGTEGNGSQLPAERGTASNSGLSNIPAAEPVSVSNIQATNFRITPDLRLGQGGESEKFRDNLAAIRTLKAIEAEGRRATSEEQRILARYVGWGGLANAFPSPETKEWKDDWKARGAELKDLLTAKEYDLARRSTLDSHYTSQTVVSAMWDAAKRLGFSGGMAAETSMGIGNFMGLMPEGMAGNTRFVGVEYDSLTARMAALLYPQATVLHSGLQKVPLPDSVFDLNIGNPPFGDQSLRFQFKPEFNRVSIHNQFFLAGIDSLKPGGLQLNVVSRYLLDAMDKTTRTMLAKKAKLVAAIRLPDTAFKENARTSVVTDIVMLQRLTPGEQAEMEAAFQAAASKPDKDREKEAERRALAALVPEWVEVTKMRDPLGGDPMTVNSYFANNPGMILGTLERSGKMQFKNDITVRPSDRDLGEMLAEAVAKLPEGIANTSQDAVAASLERYTSLSDALKIALSGQEAGSIAFNQDGQMEQVYERETPEGDYELTKRVLTESSPWSESLYQDSKGNWFTIEAKLDEQGNKLKVMKDGKPTKANVYDRKMYASESEIPAGMRLGEKRLARLQKMVKLRDLMVNQINLETEDAPPIRMEGNRQKLAKAYRDFVESEGFISRQANSALVANMPDGALVQALELAYRKEITKKQADKLGESPRPEQADPAPILRERVIPKYEPPTKAASAADALSITMSESGRVDIDRIASLLGKSEEEVIAEMFDKVDKPLIFKDPEIQQWVTRNDYLTGQVKKKLHAAQAAGFDKHVRELEAVQPEPWGAENVTVLLGSTFVPPQVYADFIQHVTGMPAKVSFQQSTNSYAVQANGSTQEKQDEWGADGVTIAGMVTDMLNSTSIKVMTKDADGNTVLDKERTELAQLKARQIASEFTDWAFANGDRRKLLVDLFNEKYNTRVSRQHDGSHLTLPGKVPDAILRMRRHQKNAIWRGISERFMLIDHAVGAGKTFTAIARAMERRRMGLSRKPAIVVPNHMVEQFTADVYRLYPGAKVLAAGGKDFEKKKRRKLFAKIASGDWDVVIIPHSSFGFIGIAPETEERYLEKELALAEQAIKDAWEESEQAESSFRKPFNVKTAERLRDKITARMDSVRGNMNKDRLLTFEQMGIDDLTVDEAHEFKNLFYSTRLKDVRGMGNQSGSQKAFDLYNKVRVLRESPTGTVTFMTGTPISNSAVEMFTMMRYLAADELNELGLEHFDAWRAQFVSADPGWEPTETGRLKEVTRLGRSWSNMRSLMDLYYSFTDSVSNDDIKKAYAEDNNGAKFPIPNVKGEKRNLIVLDPTKDQVDVLTQNMADFDSLPSIEDPYERNIERLRIMDRARKVSLDVRAAIPGHKGDEKGGKLEKIAAEIKRIYTKWDADKGTQLVFLDRSVPKSKGDDKEIKEYDELIAKRNKALLEDNEAELRRVSESLERFDPNEIAELRAAQAGGWNAYQQIKDNLIAQGIPAKEIRFVQEATNDAQKQALFDAVNAGEVRVLIGSTPRMGAGTNVQQRMVGLHHADVTWKPSDIEQREGRIIRQGNKLLDKYGIDNFEVEILAYATERSIDSKMWSLNAQKLKTINDIRNYDGSFSMDFDDNDSVSMAEMAALASGNPLLLERVKLDSDINNLEILRKQHQRKTWGYKSRMEDAENDIRNAKPRQALNTTRAAQAKIGADELAADLKTRSVTVEGQTYTNHSDAVKAAEESRKAQQGGDEEAKFSIKIGESRVTSMNGAFDKVYAALGDDSPFLAKVAGKEYRTRTDLAREMAKLATEAGPDMVDGETKLLATGQMLGFTFEANMSRGSYRGYEVDFSLVDADGRTVTSTISRPQQDSKIVTSMLSKPLADLDRGISPGYFESEARFAVQRAEKAEKELPDLRTKANMPFAKEAELVEKRARLAEVITSLSADKPASTEGDVDQPAASRVKFSRTAQGQANGTVEQTVADIVKGWATRPKIVVAFDMNDERIPERVRMEDQKQRSGGASGAPEGFYYKGTVYLMSSKLATPEDVARVLFHEALGHHGLRSVFGKKLNSILNRIAMARKSEVDAKMAQYGLKGISKVDRLTAAEEVLAELAQTKPELGLVREAIAAIRTWLRENVPGFKNLALSDDEIIRSYILPARNFVERGTMAGGESVPALRYSKGVTKSDDVVGNQGGRSADDTTPGASFDAQAAFEKHGGKGDIDESTDITAKSQAFADMAEAEGYKVAGRGDKYVTITKSFGRDADGYDKNAIIKARISDHSNVNRGHHFGDADINIAPDDGYSRDTFESALRKIKSAFVNDDLDTVIPNESTAPDSGGAMFSRSATLQKVGDTLNEAFNHPGTVSKWHTTVGSMYNLAERSPAFKPVFDAAQGFLNDVSYYATEAADMAPKILPKLESIKDLGKSPITFADNEAISKPLFEGTLSWARDVSGKPVRIEDLEAAAADKTTEQKAQEMLRAGKLDPAVLRMWQGMKQDQYAAAVNSRYESTMLRAGVVWKDAELRSLFKLTDAQIGLYKEFRSATDASIDNTAKAGMLRTAGKGAQALRDMVMDAPTAEIAGLILRDHFQAMAGDEPARSDQHIATANQMMDLADKATKLKAEGYAPLSRFGQYTVDVVVDGERKYFGLFESKRAANQRANLLAQEHGRANVIQGTLSQREFEQFQGINPESLELFGNMLGLDSTGDDTQDKVFQAYLRMTKANRSAMKKLIHRKGIAGFSEDVGRVLASFVYSNARQTAGALNLGKLGESVNAIPKGQGELKDVAIGLQKYITQPIEEAQAVRGMMFAQYLGGSIASALVNLTQPMAVSFPYLSQFGGAKKSAAALIKAYSDMVKGDKALETGLQKALHAAEEQGVVAPQEVHQLMAQARGQSSLHGGDGTRMGDLVAKSNNAFTKLALGWGKLFGVAEQVNRRATFIAAYRMAVEQGKANPAEFATKAVNETQFINNRGNKMRWGRGAVGATLMTFKSYSINYLELVHRMATQQGPEGKRAALLMLAMLVLMAGAGGLPFADDLNDLIDFMAERMGYNFSAKKKKQEFLEEVFGKPMASFIDRGITGLPGSPIDVSGRMSMANLIPGTGLLLEKRDHTRDAQELLGPVGDMAKRAFDGANSVLDGDLKRAVLAVSPKAVSNAFQGADMADKGYYADAKGFKVLSTTPGEAVAKAIGFQPQSVSMVQESNAITQRMKDTYALHAERIRSEWAKGVFEHDQDQIQKARDQLKDWNDKNPDQRIIVRIPDVMKKAREMAKDKDQRIADTAPKAMRAQLKHDIQERRAMQ